MPITPIMTTPTTVDRYQPAAYSFLRGTHPGLISEEELVRALCVDDGPVERDAAVCAISDLCAAGVVHRIQGFLVLSWTAVRTAELYDAL